MLINARRRVVQLMSLLALHSSWGPEAKWFCLPVLSCHSCKLAWFACPIGVFAHYASWHLWPLLAIGMVLLLGIFFGRLLCGWVCPFGTLQDFLYKVPTAKFKLPQWTSYIKYVILAAFVVVLPFLARTDMASFCRVCPASALQVSIPSLVTDGMPNPATWLIVRLSVLGLILAFAILSSRSFCKVLCPIGAFLAPLNFLSLWAVKVPVQNCVSCKKCDRVCAMDGKPSLLIDEGEAPNRQGECIYCYECRDTCPIHQKNNPDQTQANCGCEAKPEPRGDV